VGCVAWSKTGKAHGGGACSPTTENNPTNHHRCTELDKLRSRRASYSAAPRLPERGGPRAPTRPSRRWPAAARLARNPRTYIGAKRERCSTHFGIRPPLGLTGARWRVLPAIVGMGRVSSKGQSARIRSSTGPSAFVRAADCGRRAEAVGGRPAWRIAVVVAGLQPGLIASAQRFEASSHRSDVSQRRRSCARGSTSADNDRMPREVMVGNAFVDWPRDEETGRLVATAPSVIGSRYSVAAARTLQSTAVRGHG
jgi:hypothetical protein